MDYPQYAWTVMNQAIMGAIARALPPEATPAHILGHSGAAAQVLPPGTFQPAAQLPQELMPPLGGAPAAAPVQQGAAAAPAVPPAAAAAQWQRPAVEAGTRAREGSRSPSRTSRSAHRSRSGGERGRREDA